MLNESWAAFPGTSSSRQPPVLPGSPLTHTAPLLPELLRSADLAAVSRGVASPAVVLFSAWVQALFCCARAPHLRGRKGLSMNTTNAAPALPLPSAGFTCTGISHPLSMVQARALKAEAVITTLHPHSLANRPATSQAAMLPGGGALEVDAPLPPLCPPRAVCCSPPCSCTPGCGGLWRRREVRGCTVRTCVITASSLVGYTSRLTQSISS
mmetsp:Transcript_14492/g.25622  ORF Transcript_14492/g.25622 Transcript_14492/m.25622 type:complete len:211 (-) Transcript_14492:404-1036(-)